jgi:hypothetical protein
VWGSAPDDFWVAASGGTFLRWTVSTFTEVTAPDGSFEAIHGFAASPDGNTWAVGTTGGSGLILRWSGSAWTPKPGPTTTGTSVSVVHCAGPDDAWAVADRSILHWDGATWTEAQTTTGGSLEAITVDGAGHVWAVGALGRVEHYDGTTWSRLDSGADDTLTALWSDSMRVLAGGITSVVLQHDL